VIRHRFRTVARAFAGVLAGSIVLTGCDFDVYSLPLPGGTDVGDDAITVTVQFQDVLDLVPKSSVKVNDVSVGQVTDISLHGQTAEVELAIRKDTKLPDNAIAEIRQTSLLGEKFVSLGPPETGATDGVLGDGDVIPLERTGRNPEVEEVLGALSLLLNGGGVAQLKTITSELNKTFAGREDAARSVLTQIRDFTATLDENKAQIVNAIEALNRLAISVHQQQGDIDEALEELPSALTSVNEQRTDLVKMLKALNRLGDVGVRVIKASKDATIDSFRQLQPVLTELSNSGDNFVKAINVFLTYPFVDEVVGRDPQVARNLHMGDYTNLSVTLDIDLTQGGLPPPPGVPDIPCTHLEDIPPAGPVPPPSELCQDAIDAINECTAGLSETPPDLTACEGLPAIVIEQVCNQVGLPVCPPPDLPVGSGLGGGGGGPNLPAPSVTLPTILPPLVPGLGGAIDGLGRSATSWNKPAQGGPTMGQLSAVYDPMLVSLLVPGLVVSR
jgi:phospholipid/cholesterol/gamma-HCH transport system substrate-binding protein